MYFHLILVGALSVVTTSLSPALVLEGRIRRPLFSYPIMRQDLKQAVSQVPSKLRQNHVAPWKISVNGCEISARGFGTRPVCNCTRSQPRLEFALYGFDDALEIESERTTLSYDSNNGGTAKVRVVLANGRSRFLLRALIETNSGTCELFPRFPIRFNISYFVINDGVAGQRGARLEPAHFSEVVEQVFNHFLPRDGSVCSAELEDVKRISTRLFDDPQKQ